MRSKRLHAHSDRSARPSPKKRPRGKRGAATAGGPAGSIGAAGEHARRTEPSQRQLRVAEQLRHLIADDLAQGAFHDPRLERTSITVAEVRMSRDLKHAVVFVTELGRPLAAET